VSVDLVRIVLRPGDRLLVCSDGLHDYFTPAELAVHLTGGDPDATLARMIEEVRQAGGHDNMTGVVIESRSRPAATIPGIAEVDDPLDDEPTNPIGIPVEAPRVVQGPLDGVPDDTLASIVDRQLREQSRPVVMPTDGTNPGN